MPKSNPSTDMKKTILTLAFLALAITLQGQEKATQNTYKRDGNTFVQTQTRNTADDTATAYLWRDKQGNEYPIYLHRYTKGEKAGRITAYVIRTSKKTGKDYKYYLPNGEQIAKEILNETK